MRSNLAVDADAKRRPLLRSLLLVAGHLYVRSHMNCLIRIIAATSIAAQFVVLGASETEVENYIKSIRSVEQVKASIRRHLTAECGTGSCVNTTTTEICTLTGALDVRAGNSISSGDPKFTTRPDIPISRPDLELFQLIWSQCKPTSYQYWNYGTVLHVAYDPEPEIDKTIRRALGIRTAETPANRTSRDSSHTKVDEKLRTCLMPKAQYGQYSSYDGGKSAASLLQDACPTEYLQWVQACTASGETRESCVRKAALIAQMAIKLFNK
jgi:hypothetical protein